MSNNFKEPEIPADKHIGSFLKTAGFGDHYFWAYEQNPGGIFRFKAPEKAISLDRDQVSVYMANLDEVCAKEMEAERHSLRIGKDEDMEEFIDFFRDIMPSSTQRNLALRKLFHEISDHKGSVLVPAWRNSVSDGGELDLAGRHLRLESAHDCNEPREAFQSGYSGSISLIFSVANENGDFKAGDDRLLLPIVCRYEDFCITADNPPVLAKER